VRHLFALNLSALGIRVRVCLTAVGPLVREAVNRRQAGKPDLRGAGVDIGETRRRRIPDFLSSDIPYLFLRAVR